MTIDQLLAVLVVVTFVNVALVVAVWQGGPLSERWRWLSMGRIRGDRRPPAASSAAAPGAGQIPFATTGPLSLGHVPVTAVVPPQAGEPSVQPVMAPPAGQPAGPPLAPFAVPPSPVGLPFADHVALRAQPPSGVEPAAPLPVNGSPGAPSIPNAQPGPSDAVRQAPDGFDTSDPAPQRPPRLDSLPTDLADLLSRPAAIDPRDDTPASGLRPVAQPAGAPPFQPILAWLPRVGSTASSTGLTLDPLTSLEGPSSWGRILEIENARLLRYRRPVTIVMAELEGVRRLAERVGQDAVDRLLPVVADAFRKEARGSDWIARIGEARFAALMSETDEIQAINYVERVRLCCEPWLGSAAVPMRLAIGWASPPASGDLEYAVRRAEERMHADRRGAGKGIVPMRSPGPRVVSLPARAAEELSVDLGEGEAPAPDARDVRDRPAEPIATDARDAGQKPHRRRSDRGGAAPEGPA